MPSPCPPRLSPTILAIDDDPAFLLALAEMLEEVGYTVLLATGAQVLDATWPDPVHLILLDLMLPGMSGLELSRHLRTHPRLRAVPIVAMSGAPHLRAHAVADLPIVAYLAKPFDLAALYATVAEHLGPERPDA